MIRIQIARGTNNLTGYGSGYQIFTTNTTMVAGTNIGLKLRFFEVDTITRAVTEIGTKDITVGLSTTYITAKYLAQSRTNIASSTGLATPF
jgi:hypothetical protein